MKQFTAFLAFALGATVGLIVGCQRYDFEPVSPVGLSQTTQSYNVVAKKLKPNVMLVADESGSMTLPINAADPKCQTPPNCGTIPEDPANYCPAACPTRTSELRSAMRAFFADAGTVARFGLTTFPDYAAGGECGIGKVRVDISSSNDVNAELQANADLVNSTLQNDRVLGGTPTSATIQMLGSYAGFSGSGRDNFIILETDGVPNCNNNTAALCAPGACTCTAGDAYCCRGTPQDSRGCLDQVATANAIAALGAPPRNIQTFVIGFGEEAAGSAPTLNAMAEAGGRPRLCPDGGSGSCGPNNPCIGATGRCFREYYQVNNASELAQVLDEIARTGFAKPCEYTLNELPSDPTLLSVVINGQGIRRGPDTWSFDPAGPKIFLLGAICDQVKNATAGVPVQVDIRIVRTL